MPSAENSSRPPVPVDATEATADVTPIDTERQPAPESADRRVRARWYPFITWDGHHGWRRGAEKEPMTPDEAAWFDAMGSVVPQLAPLSAYTDALREMRNAFLECTGTYAQDLAYDDLARAARLLGEDEPKRRMCETCGERPAEPGEGECTSCDPDLATPDSAGAE